jgi:molybdenum cofactor synthesis domain-containing protein
MPPVRIVSVNLSEKTGTIKKPVGEVVIDARGVVGDAHAGTWHRQVSLLAQESIDRFAAETGRQVAPGEFAENLTIEGVDLRRASVLDRFHFGEVRLELTQIGKACHGEACAIFREVGKCVMPAEGVFCRVLSGGVLRAGDEGEYLPRTLVLRVITLSDRAAAGEYEDRAGPRLRELLEAFFRRTRWRVEVASALLPDDPDRLRAELAAARADGTDAVFTTGGTGVGPRDFTPETVAAFCDRLIPGIMEHIRLKFGREKPNALLSRSVVGLAGTMQVYALPGSVRAVEEYAGEILRTFEHVLLTAHGLDVH